MTRDPYLLSLILVTFLLAESTTATPSPVPSLPGWLDVTLPTKGETIENEIKCYGLPYGGIGFTSHILTYYTLFMLSSDRSPWTWRRNRHWRFDLTLAVLALAGTSVTSIFTMVRCRNRWQFVCVAVWKMSMSITLSAISTTAALRIRKNSGRAKEGEGGGPAGGREHVSRQKGLYWLLLYVPGLVAGFAGLISIVLQSWSTHLVQIVTIHFLSMSSAFGSLVLLIVLGLFLDRTRQRREGYVPTATTSPQMNRIAPEMLFQSLSSTPLADPDQESLEVAKDGPDIPLITITRESMDNDLLLHPPNATTPVHPQKPATPNPLRVPAERLKPRFNVHEPTPIEKRLMALGDLVDRIDLPALSSLQAAILGGGGGDSSSSSSSSLNLDVLVDVGSILLLPLLFTLGIFGALYSDFALGSIAADNMVGVPSGDYSLLYWGYFVFKRLPMLSV